MYQGIVQDVRQIRAVCQQLAQVERQNAQMLSQGGMMNQNLAQQMVQRENMTSQQLQQCVTLCDRIEQSVSRASYGGSGSQFGGGRVTSMGGAGLMGGAGSMGSAGSFGGQQQQQQQSVNNQAFNSLMQADRGLNRQEGPTYSEYGSAFGVSGGAGSYGAQNSFGGGAQQSFGGGQSGAQQSFGGSQGYSNQTSTGLGTGFNQQAFSSLMQADRGLNRQEGPTYSEYGSAFGVSGGAGSYGAQNSFGGGAQQSFGGGQYGAQQSFGGGQSYSNQTSTGLGTGFNQQAFSSLMQADRGLNRQEGPTYSEYGSAFGVSGGAGSYGAQNSFGGGAQQSFGGGQYGAQQSFGGSQAYSNQTSTGLGSGLNSQAFNSLMQADRGLNRQEGPTYSEYGSAFGVSGGAGAQQSFGGGAQQ